MRFAFVVACLGFSRLHLTRADNDDQERDDLASSPIPALKEQFDPSPETLATDYLDNEHEIGPDIEIVESSDGILNEIDPNYHMERNKKPKSKSKPTSKPGKAPKEKPVPPGEPPGQGCEDREDLDEILHSGMFNPCPTLGRAYHGFHGKRWPLIASSTCGGKDKMMATACFLNGTFRRAIWGDADTEVAKCMVDLHRDTPFKCITVKGSRCNFNNYAERGGLIDYAEKPGPGYKKLDMYKFTELEADAIKNVIDQLQGKKVDAKQRANPQFWVWFMDLRSPHPSYKHLSFSLYYDKHNGCG